jgi:hypothetical protein
MTRHSRALDAAIAALVIQAGLLGPARAAAQSLDEVNVVETYLHAKAVDIAIFAQLFGIPAPTTLEFVRGIDATARTFWYAALPGQTYGGLPFSMLSDGVFDDGLGKYRWSTSGAVGDRAWKGEGTFSWCCESSFSAALAPLAFDGPVVRQDGEETKEGEFEETVEDTEGNKYTATGVAKHGTKTSTTSGTLKHKDSKGTISFKGEDTYVPMHTGNFWEHTIKFYDEKGKRIPPYIKPFKVKVAALGCDTPSCAGLGSSSAELTAIPEPASIVMLATGVLAIVGAGACRRRAPRQGVVAR